jgi:nucleotide-binding universal stress UspA family protein
MYKSILLPLDGSSLAEQALPHALALVERFQKEMILRTPDRDVYARPIWAQSLADRKRSRPSGPRLQASCYAGAGKKNGAKPEPGGQR